MRVRTYKQLVRTRTSFGAKKERELVTPPASDPLYKSCYASKRIRKVGKTCAAERDILLAGLYSCSGGRRDFPARNVCWLIRPVARRRVDVTHHFRRFRVVVPLNDGRFHEETRMRRV